MPTRMERWFNHNRRESPVSLQDPTPDELALLFRHLGEPVFEPPEPPPPTCLVCGAPANWMKLYCDEDAPDELWT
jgi:hypothetical protein